MQAKLKGCEASPTAGIIDTRSVKTTEAGGPRGYDAGQKINQQPAAGEGLRGQHRERFGMIAAGLHKATYATVG